VKVLPLTVSGNEKSGALVPSGSMVLGVLAIFEDCDPKDIKTCLFLPYSLSSPNQAQPKIGFH
jgi:hypothetical protein